MQEQFSLLDPEVLMALVALVSAIGGIIKTVLDGRRQRAENLALKKAIGALRTENADLHDDIDNLILSLGQSDRTIKALKSDYDTLNRSFSDLKQQYEILKAKNQALEAQYAALKAENEILRQKVNGVEKKQTGELKQ